MQPQLLLRTLARVDDPGRPRSRANAQAIREAVARKPTAAKTIAAIMIEVSRFVSRLNVNGVGKL